MILKIFRKRIPVELLISILVLPFFGCLSFYGCLSFFMEKPNCKLVQKGIPLMVDSTIMDFGNYEVMLPPSTYCPGVYIDNIFAVPKDNSVGTNDIGNAVMTLEFRDKGSLRKRTVKRDFLSMVSGPFEFCFLPVWSDKEIAYSQSKGFVLINFATRKVETHTICPGMYGCEIGSVSVLNANERVFVIEVLQSSGNNEGDIWEDKYLRIVQFKRGNFSVLAERPAGIKMYGQSEPWFVYQNKIFIYNDSLTELGTFDARFSPLDHVFTDAFNKNEVNFRCMREIAVHPTLPFALIRETGKSPKMEKVRAINSLPRLERNRIRDTLYNEMHRHTLYLFRWTHPDPEQRFVPLLSAAGSVWGNYNPENACEGFTFSPDGKWVVFKDKSQDSKNPVYVAVPIDENNPLYLGKPVKLGKSFRKYYGVNGMTTTAWTTNPTAFVACDGAVLYRWNLDAYHSFRKVKVPPGTPDPFEKEQNY